MKKNLIILMVSMLINLNAAESKLEEDNSLIALEKNIKEKLFLKESKSDSLFSNISILGYGWNLYILPAFGVAIRDELMGFEVDARYADWSYAKYYSLSFSKLFYSGNKYKGKKDSRMYIGTGVGLTFSETLHNNEVNYDPGVIAFIGKEFSYTFFDIGFASTLGEKIDLIPFPLIRFGLKL